MRLPSRRKAISPILATVILIAITLIAAVAIATFVFGIFGSSASPATYSIVSSSLTCLGNNVAVPATGLWASYSGAASAGHGLCAMTVDNSGSAGGSIISAGPSNDIVLISAAGVTAGATFSIAAGSSHVVFVQTTYAAGALASGNSVTGYLVPGGSAANLNFVFVAP